MLQPSGNSDSFACCLYSRLQALDAATRRTQCHASLLGAGFPPTTCMPCTFMWSTSGHRLSDPNDHRTHIKLIEQGIDNSYRGAQLRQKQGRPPASLTCELDLPLLLASWLLYECYRAGIL